MSIPPIDIDFPSIHRLDAGKMDFFTNPGVKGGLRGVADGLALGTHISCCLSLGTHRSSSDSSSMLAEN